MLIPSRTWIKGFAVVASALGLVLLLNSATATASGRIYKYMDKDGTIHFSDAPVDSRYNQVHPGRRRGLSISPDRTFTAPFHRGYDGLIYRASVRHGVEPELVKAVIAAESNFKRKAVSRVGAQGLMQLMPATARELGVEDSFGAAENIDGGTRYLRKMLDRFGDVSRALAAYNAGPNAVVRHRGIPPYRETQAYVKRVLQYYEGYRGEFERLEYRTGSISPPAAPSLGRRR